MDPSQRFNLDRPCPVCGGHPGLPQGEGRRCYGFISDIGLHAHCTRAEHAGRLDRNGNSNAYAHRLDGDCPCGEVHGTEPPGARPLPANTVRMLRTWTTIETSSWDGHLSYGPIGTPTGNWRVTWRGGTGRAAARKSAP